MVVGLVFFYMAVAVYGALLLLLVGLTVYSSYRFQRRTTHALLGLIGWLLAAPILVIALFVFDDTFGLGLVGGQNAEDPNLGLPFLLAYAGSSPLFLVPLVRRFLSTRERIAQPA